MYIIYNKEKHFDLFNSLLKLPKNTLIYSIGSK